MNTVARTTARTPDNIEAGISYARCRTRTCNPLITNQGQPFAVVVDSSQEQHLPLAQPPLAGRLNGTGEGRCTHRHPHPRTGQ